MSNYFLEVEKMVDIMKKTFKISPSIKNIYQDFQNSFYKAFISKELNSSLLI